MRDVSYIIQNKSELFLDHIKTFSDLSRNHRVAPKNGGFPLFMIDNREYYEQSFFDELIENGVWRFLVNGFFHELFTSEYCMIKNISCSWQDMHPQLTTSYVEAIEGRYFVEFVITFQEKHIGYRYTNIYYTEDHLREMMEMKNLDEVVVIDFSSDIQSAFLHPLNVPRGCNNMIRKMTLKDFFCDFFSESEYYEYVTGARKAVEEAYKYVGKQTVTNLTLQSLPYFLQTALRGINDFPYTATQYVPIKTPNNTAISWYGTGTLAECDKRIINENFYNLKRFHALIGREDFAKSFITSEYLYQTLKDNNRFDFTAIVTGYFKSIEQLLFLLLSIIEIDGHSGDVWIQSKIPFSRVYRRYQGEFRLNPTNTNKTQVRVKTGNGNFYDSSFAALVYMLQDYPSGWAVSDQAKNIISALLLIYSDECRNEHFHKENIYDIAEVEDIRNKTYLLLYYVLGGYDFSIIGQSENTLLGIIDNSFENLYRKIMEYGPGNYYYLTFPSGPPMFVALPMKQSLPEYDNDGLIINPSLRFVKMSRESLGDWRKDDWGEIEDEFSDEKTITVCRNYMPTDVKYIDKITGETKAINW